MITQKRTRVKSLTRNKTAETRTIDTSLMNKEEVFRMLSLAEVTGLPTLLIGPPGVAKTKAVLEYAKAWMIKNIDKNDIAALEKANQDFMNKIFILETDEGTKSSEVKGMLDLEKLFTENKYELIAPITEAEVVIVNEIDKASSNIRNSLLGVMNEKYLFCGKKKIPCKWKLFIGTCNAIPKDEVDSPFWDRFVLKMNVNPITAGEIQKYFAKGGRDYRETFSLGIPNKQEMENISIPLEKLEKFIEVSYKHCSNRTLTYLPNLIKAVSFIWDQSIDTSMVKVCSLMVNDGSASALKDKLLSPAMRSVISKVDMLKTTTKQVEVQDILKDVGILVSQYASDGKLEQSDVDDINKTINYILDNHELEEDQDAEEVFESVEEEID